MVKDLKRNHYTEAKVEYRERMVGGERHEEYYGFIEVLESGHVKLRDEETQPLIPPERQLKIETKPE